MADNAAASTSPPAAEALARARAGSYIALYVVLSAGQIFFNKWVLSADNFDFPFPITLTTGHMIFSSILCFLLFKVFKLKKLSTGMTMQTYVSSVVPIGAMFAMTLWFGNTAYLYISVSFAQMLKACMPVVVLLVGAAVGLEELTWRMLGIMSVISGGVVVASVGEINFSWHGVAYQMLGVVGEAGRLILVELLLKKKGFKMDPLSMMYYVSPASAVCLLLPWYLLEQPRVVARLAAGGSRGLLAWLLQYDSGILTLNALCTFALNVSVFLVILHTSALTIRVAGVVKDWLVVLVSALLFADTRLTPVNLFGYAVAILGVVMYNRERMGAPSSSSSGGGVSNVGGVSGSASGSSHASPSGVLSGSSSSSQAKAAQQLHGRERHVDQEKDVESVPLIGVMGR